LQKKGWGEKKRGQGEISLSDHRPKTLTSRRNFEGFFHQGERRKKVKKKSRPPLSQVSVRHGYIGREEISLRENRSDNLSILERRVRGLFPLQLE